MRIRSLAVGLAAVVALIAPAAVASATPAANGALAVKASPPPPSGTFDWYSYTSGAEIVPHGSGAQVTASASAGAQFTRDQFVADLGLGLGFYRYRDTVTNLCLQMDKGIAGWPLVEATCSTSEPALDQQRFTDPVPNNPGGMVYNYWDAENNGGPSEAMCSDNSADDVAFNCFNQTWSLG